MAAEFPITSNPQFSGTMEKLTTTDRGHPDSFNPKYQVLLDNDNYLKTKVESMSAAPIQVTVPAAEWTAAAPYIQTIPCPGITAADSPVPGIIYPDDMDEASKKAIDKSVGMITDIETGDGTITVTCKFKKPTVDIPLMLKGV